VSLVDPLINKLKNEHDGNKSCHTGIVDLVYFDLAKNVQNTCLIFSKKYPHITVGHGPSIMFPFSSLMYSPAQKGIQ
jgi:hypothetical protein